jgi:hypothetical protein
MALTAVGGRFPNQSGRAYHRTARWLKGAEVDSCTRMKNDIWRCKLNRDSRTAWLAWRPSGDATWRLPDELPVKEIETLDGKNQIIDGSSSVRVGEKPLLLKADGFYWGD